MIAVGPGNDDPPSICAIGFAVLAACDGSVFQTAFTFAVERSFDSRRWSAMASFVLVPPLTTLVFGYTRVTERLSPWSLSKYGMSSLSIFLRPRLTEPLPESPLL